MEDEWRIQAAILIFKIEGKVYKLWFLFYFIVDHNKKAGVGIGIKVKSS